MHALKRDCILVWDVMSYTLNQHFDNDDNNAVLPVINASQHSRARINKNILLPIILYIHIRNRTQFFLSFSTNAGRPFVHDTLRNTILLLLWREIYAKHKQYYFPFFFYNPILYNLWRLLHNTPSRRRYYARISTDYISLTHEHRLSNENTFKSGGFKVLG